MRSSLVLLLSLCGMASSFQSFNPMQGPRSDIVVMEAHPKSMEKWGKAAVAVLATAVVLSTATPSFADEYGRETETDTLFTGETTMICTKRGPLGACLKTVQRTSSNDNDKSDKYFQTPTEMIKRKDLQAQMDSENEGNELIQKLRLQTEANREKNELAVQQRTLLNDASASFGPFDGQVVILNENGNGFTLLSNPQAMRLKSAGFIKDKKFIKQPTQEELDKALESGPNIFQKAFGGGGGGDE
ncbi:unnamed protein product [Cylindrotheca closterium]|uniref:Uncharacterized protein n=1 Tax=Cylindrotheca closterium TaxID=2856 RepID=A0AAD2CQT5_9STRA|nr:unnamed protein product [Cylindrotheca closterium]